MLDKRTIPVTLINSCLQEDLGIHAAEVTFLPPGSDIH